MDKGYQNYSCTANTTLIAGNSYPLTVVTDQWVQQNVQVWIDYNNDGSFSSTERVMQSLNTLNHTSAVIVPISGVRNTYLRMRAKAQISSYPMTGPCINAQPQQFYGQVEDYAVMILNPVGVNENYIAQEIKLYPNPSTGTFSLEIPSVFIGYYHLEVQDMIGKTVVKQTLKVVGKEAFQLNLEHLPKGVYLLKLFNEKNAGVKKLIIE